MSLHSYSRCWLHLIWATLDRQRVLSKSVGAQVSGFLHEYAQSHSHHNRVAAYIAEQEEHHRTRTFAEEFEEFVRRYGLQWKLESA